MVRTISKIAIAGLGLLALALFTPQAKASGADFFCGGTTCTGTITVTGSGSSATYSSTGIGVMVGAFDLNVGDGDEMTESYSLAFDTATKNLSISDSDGDVVLMGTISHVAVTNTTGTTALNFTVFFTSPGGFAGPGHVAFLLKGSASQCGTNAPNCVNSVDISVQPTPEPASLLLLGTGLLGLGGVARRRWLN